VEELEKRLPGLLYRTINNRDIAPRLPPRFLDYRHVGSVCYLDESLEAMKDHDNGIYTELLERAWKR
jgi:hypothetical protein